MARVRLRWDETRGDELPEVCMRCGAPADVHRGRTFSWHPQWVLLLLFGGLLPFLIVAVILTKRMRVEVPLCDAHKNHWLARAAVIWTTFFGLIGLGVVAMLLMGPQGNDPVGGYVCAGTVVGLFIWLISAAILQSTSIRPVEITADDITLTRVASGFVDALRDQRDAARDRRRLRRDDYDDEDDEYEDDRPRRQRRYREDDD
ncbi:hypothetical protein J0H58_17330 [bacterium]|nr:hypothetical protein [bacterium]